MDNRPALVSMSASMSWSAWCVGRPTISKGRGAWRTRDQIVQAVGLLRRLSQGRDLQVAMESSGTYGDAFRQALHDTGIPLQRVQAKAAHDYAEVFDGVPFQHDGKDAAVIAELLALGKSQPWPYAPPSEWEEELAFWVDEIEAQRRIASLWLGRLEGLLARHWPEVTPRLLRVSSGTLLRALMVYGGPAELAADPKAAKRLSAWGGSFLCPEKVAQLLSLCPRHGGRSPGSDRPAAVAADGRAGPRRPPPGAARPVAVAPAGPGPCDPSGPGSGDRRADGLRALGRPGRSARLPLRQCLSQGDGLESAGIQQRDLRKSVADQQARQRAGAAMVVLRGVALRATGGVTGLVRGQESAGTAPRPCGRWWLSCAAGAGHVPGRG